MNISAIYHRPESEFAYLYDEKTMHIRLKTAVSDIKSVQLLFCDTYLPHGTSEFNSQIIEMKKISSTTYNDFWGAEINANHNRLQYAFIIKDNDNKKVYYCDRGFYNDNNTTFSEPNTWFRLPYLHKADMFTAPDWAKHTVWYQIFPERFANGNPSINPEGCLEWGSKSPSTRNFFGGDLKGIIDNLDYIEQLGVNGIYLCPIFKAPSNHKYDTVDYYEIDPAFGTKQDFHKLVETAHAKGIKIMLDAVFNHIGYYSPQWQDVLKNRENSTYKDWFYLHDFSALSKNLTDKDFEINPPYEVFAFTPYMPKLNTSNIQVREYLIGAAKYWIEEFDIDAWRLDVANEVDHQFWKLFYAETTQIKKDFYIVGEVWHSAQNWLCGDEFHAVMNYAYTSGIIEHFVKKQLSAKEMITRIEEQKMLYRNQTIQVMFNLLDSHDTPRLITVCGGNIKLAQMAWAFMFLQKGAPCIYYGSEIGMDGEHDPGCRKCMVWEKESQNKEMLEFMKSLIKFRKDNNNFFINAETKWICAEEKGEITFLYKINEDDVNEKVLTASFNSGKNEILIQTSGSLALSHLAYENNGKISLKPHGFAVFLS